MLYVLSVDPGKILSSKSVPYELINWRSFVIVGVVLSPASPILQSCLPFLALCDRKPSKKLTRKIHVRTCGRGFRDPSKAIISNVLLCFSSSINGL